MKTAKEYQIIKVSPFGTYSLVTGGFEKAENALSYLKLLIDDIHHLHPERLRAMYKIAYVETTYIAYLFVAFIGGRLLVN